MLIWDYKARQVYGDACIPERSRRFYELCLRYRFTPPPPLPWDKVFVKQPDGTWVAKWDEFDREVEAWMSKGATAFSIGGILRWGTKPPPENEREDVAAKLKLLGEHLKRKGWSERFYFYVFDEPSTAEFANIEALCRFVHQHAPNLNILLTAGYGATGPFGHTPLRPKALPTEPLLAPSTFGFRTLIALMNPFAGAQETGRPSLDVCLHQHCRQNLP